MTENEQKALIYKYFRTTEVPKGLVLPSDPALIAGILGDYEAANDLFKEALSVYNEWVMNCLRAHQYNIEKEGYAGLQTSKALNISDQFEDKILADQINKAKELVQEQRELLQVIGLNKAMR